MLYKYGKKVIVLLVFIIITPLLILQVSHTHLWSETYYPVESTNVLNNPYMGWAPSAEGGPYAQPHRLVYINTTWSELEPEKEQYAFQFFEDKYQFDYWRSKGIHIILRTNMDFPSNEKHMDIPNWLYSEIDGDGIWYDMDYGLGFSPNYSNPKLIAYHQKLIQALAARYNEDDLIPIIALGSIGHWGEWHTKQDELLPIPFPSIEISNQYVDHYLDAFTNKFLVMRRPFSIAKENNIGLYNDSFGNMDQTYNNFISGINNGYFDQLAAILQPPMPDYWKQSPSGGEIANPPGMLCFESTQIESTLQQVRDCHTSWLGPSCPAYQALGSELQDNFGLVLKTMGYRFTIHSIKHPPKVKAGNTLSIKMILENKGVAPFYYSWPLELSLVDVNDNIVFKTILSEDIKSWLPGKHEISTSINIPSDLAEGKYRLCAGILNPATNAPSIDFAIENRRIDGRYILDQVNISKPAK